MFQIILWLCFLFYKCSVNSKKKLIKLKNDAKINLVTKNEDEIFRYGKTKMSGNGKKVVQLFMKH